MSKKAAHGPAPAITGGDPSPTNRPASRWEALYGRAILQAGIAALLERAIMAGGRGDHGLQAAGDLPAADPGRPAAMSFVARFGRVIVRAGIAAIPQALFTYQAALGLSPQQIWFIAYILAHRWS